MHAQQAARARAIASMPSQSAHLSTSTRGLDGRPRAPAAASSPQRARWLALVGLLVGLSRALADQQGECAPTSAAFSHTPLPPAATSNEPPASVATDPPELANPKPAASNCPPHTIGFRLQQSPLEHEPKKIFCFYEIQDDFRPQELNSCLCSHVVYSYVAMRKNLSFIAGKKGKLSRAQSAVVAWNLELASSELELRSFTSGRRERASQAPTQANGTVSSHLAR